jgi:hypothetical protein
MRGLAVRTRPAKNKRLSAPWLLWHLSDPHMLALPSGIQPSTRAAGSYVVRSSDISILPTRFS